MTGPIVRDFPDIERLIAHIFLDQLGGADHVGAATPGDLENHLPFLRTVRAGGPRTHLIDYPTFEVDLFTSDEAAGKPLASQIANRLLSKPPPHPSLDVVGCDPAFRELPWGDNENVRRWSATFYAETRMVRVALLP